MAASLAQCKVSVASMATMATPNITRQQRVVASSTRRGGLAAAHRQAATLTRQGKRGATLRTSANDADADAKAAAAAAMETESKVTNGKGKSDGGEKAKGNGAITKKVSGGNNSKNEEARKALMLALEKGEPVSGRVEVANRGGLILRIFNGRIRAFLPLSQMASSRTAGIKGAAAAQQKDATVAAMESQVGSIINVKLMSVDDKKIVVSERALAQDQGAKALKVGVRASGRIVSLSDFGAFVELSEDDPQAPRLEGLIHISELSWNRISHPRDVVRVGDEVDVKVLDVVPGEPGVNGRPTRVTFSLKQLQADPLLETLDTIMPVAMPEPSVDEDELLDTPLPGLLDICANLLTEDGIDAVIPGRQAVEQRVVSQDLELWLTNVVVEDGYNLLARAGRQVQEIHVVTRLDRDAIKRAIKRATSALK